MGINKCIKIAKESLFWPNINNEIKQYVLRCGICAKYSQSKKSEELKPHEIKTIPWLKVGCDIFEFKNNKYLLLIDYYTKFVEIDELNNNCNNCREN